MVPTDSWPLLIQWPGAHVKMNLHARRSCALHSAPKVPSSVCVFVAGACFLLVREKNVRAIIFFGMGGGVPNLQESASIKLRPHYFGDKNSTTPLPPPPITTTETPYPLNRLE